MPILFDLRLALILAAAMLSGCATNERVVLQRVNVPIPIECQEPVPVRPSMPTERLDEDADIFMFTKAAVAEIERREGYELRLVTALENCRALIKH